MKKFKTIYIFWEREKKVENYGGIKLKEELKIRVKSLVLGVIQWIAMDAQNKKKEEEEEKIKIVIK